jgi:hypothetical protein
MILLKKKEQDVERLRMETVTRNGENLKPLLKRITGSDRREAKKAMVELNRTFPNTQATIRQEKKQLVELKTTLSATDFEYMVNDEKEADELQSIKYKRRSAQWNEHYVGMKQTSDGSQGETVPWLNPEWVKLHFHEKFLAAVRAYENDDRGFVPVPVGMARTILDIPPPMSSIVHSVRCHYHQGTKAFCIFYSFASALSYIGYHKESERVRLESIKYEHASRDAQIESLKKVSELLFLCGQPVVIWGKKKKRYKRFDVYNNISTDPTLIIPWGGDGGVQHAITIVGKFVFDSTHEYALHLTKESLDWCCNTRLGFKGVHLAIRFPLK